MGGNASLGLGMQAEVQHGDDEGICARKKQTVHAPCRRGDDVDHEGFGGGRVENRSQGDQSGGDQHAEDMYFVHVGENTHGQYDTALYKIHAYQDPFVVAFVHDASCKGGEKQHGDEQGYGGHAPMRLLEPVCS